MNVALIRLFKRYWKLILRLKSRTICFKIRPENTTVERGRVPCPTLRARNGESGNDDLIIVR